MTTKQLAANLDKLSAEMEKIGRVMQQSENWLWRQHGAELCGAARIAAEWCGELRKPLDTPGATG